MDVTNLITKLSAKWTDTIGNSLPFVSLVYIAVLLPWGFLYFHDFISVRWTSIRRMHRNGIIHIIAVSVPMPIIIMYIIFQQTADEPDHKEMYAAITALVLSLYHLSRTIWGLHQLSQFRMWAFETALTMERAAYRCSHVPQPSVPPPPMDNRRSSSFSSYFNSRISSHSHSSGRPSPSSTPFQPPIPHIPLTLNSLSSKLPPSVMDQSHNKPKPKPKPKAPILPTTVSSNNFSSSKITLFRKRSKRNGSNDDSQYQTPDGSLPTYFGTSSSSPTTNTTSATNASMKEEEEEGAQRPQISPAKKTNIFSAFFSFISRFFKSTFWSTSSNSITNDRKTNSNPSQRRKSGSTSNSFEHTSLQLPLNRLQAKTDILNDFEGTTDRCRTHDTTHASSKSLSGLILDSAESTASASVSSNPVGVNAKCISKARLNEINESIQRMKVNSTIIDNEFIASDAPRTRPFSTSFINPHEAFIRWSVAYLAQFGNAWIKESRTRSYDNSTWDGQRYNLALDVWATAALRMETACSKVDKVHYASGIPTSNESQISFLSPALWYFFVSNQIDLFSKDTMIRKCMLSGDGFPYRRPILKGDSPIPNKGMYRGLIKDVLAGLPASFYDVVDGIVPDQLYWFAIFTWIAQWNGCEKDNGTLRMFQSNSSDQGNFPSSPFPMDGQVGEGVLKPTHAPVRTLQDQLGLDDVVSLDLCPFPFIRQKYGRYLWRNRSVLQVSARIDNWLSIRIGIQFVKLFKLYSDTFGPKTQAYKDVHAIELNEAGDDLVQDKNDDDDDDVTNGKRGPNSPEAVASPSSQYFSNQQLPMAPVIGKKGNVIASSTSLHNNGMKKKLSNVEKRSRRIFHFHRRLEIDRLRYQLGRMDVPLHHLDQGITLMGCAMETVRSFLAEDVRKNMENTSSSSSSLTPEDSANNKDTANDKNNDENNSSDNDIKKKKKQNDNDNQTNTTAEFPFAPGSLWCPKIRPDKYESFGISAQLVECLNVIILDGQDRFDSTVQERLLWECQNGIVRLLDKDFLHIDHPSYTRAPGKQLLMMLTILSFSGIIIQRFGKPEGSSSADVEESQSRGSVKDETERGNEEEEEEPKTTKRISTSSSSHPSFSMNNRSEFHKDALSFILHLPAAPQDISVVVDASTKLRKLRLRLHCGKHDTHFRWQDWRDAFLGRLSGKAEWQRGHFMRDLYVNRTTSLISCKFRDVPAGEDRAIPLWEGWQPFRARIRKFELQHSSLIIVNQFMPTDSSFSPGTSSDSIVHNLVHELSVYDTTHRMFSQGIDVDDGADAQAYSSEDEEQQEQQEQLTGAAETIEGASSSSAAPSVTPLRKAVRFEVLTAGASAGFSNISGGRRDLQKFNQDGRADDLEASPYFLAHADALSDASMHVDSVLRLNTMLFDGSTGITGTSAIPRLNRSNSNRSPYSGDEDVTRISPGSSGDMRNVSLKMIMTRPGGQPELLLNRVNEQDADAMTELAINLLEGKKPYKHDRERALSLMERAIIISKDIHTANRYIKALLDPLSGKKNSSESSSGNNSVNSWTYLPNLLEKKDSGQTDDSSSSYYNNSAEKENLRKALAVVDLLWRDMPTRFEVETGPNGVQRLRCKLNGTKAEEKRIRKLVKIHLRIVRAKRSADIMVDLGNHLSTWGTSKRDEKLAITLYESAIISDRNVWAMVGLALKYVDRNMPYACQLFYRAINDNWSGMAIEAANGLNEIPDAKNNDVVEYVKRLKLHGDQRATQLLQHI